jgi:hypothetical protein
MQTRSWRGDDGSAPRFGAGGRRWFYRSIVTYLWTRMEEAKITLSVSPELSRSAADLLTPRAEEFVEWRPTIGYAGADRTTGEFRIQWAAVCAEVARRHAELDPAGVRTGLDEWLRKDMGHAYFKSPAEPHVATLLGRREWRAFRRKHDTLLTRWPRLCEDCGSEFIGERRNAKRCPACRANP